ncbi:MAG: T9SS type A sorting domain-containing protein, partial [Ignavibacteriae bacterium]|nr:T9SS type A sorting domain-containing protein [Ignavibacteriota bacterium]
NPFNPSTKIQYTVPNSSHVTLKVYDLLGREVSTLVNGEQAAGSYEVAFRANDLANGTYFYKLQAGSFTSVKKMMLLK